MFLREKNITIVSLTDPRVQIIIAPLSSVNAAGAKSGKTYS